MYNQLQGAVSEFRKSLQEFCEGYSASGLQVKKLQVLASAGAEGNLRGGLGAIVESGAHQFEIACALDDAKRGTLSHYDAGYLTRYLLHKREREFADGLHEIFRSEKHTE